MQICDECVEDEKEVEETTGKADGDDVINTNAFDWCEYLSPSPDEVFLGDFLWPDTDQASAVYKMPSNLPAAGVLIPNYLF